MPVFLERFVLPGLVGLAITVGVANVVQLDWPERAGVFVVAVLAAFLVARFVHRQNKRTSAEASSVLTGLSLAKAAPSAPAPAMSPLPAAVPASPPVSVSPAPGAAEASRVPGRTYLSVTIKDLWRPYDELTSMMADEMNKHFIGGWIRVRLAVFDVTGDGLGGMMIGARETKEPGGGVVLMRFAKDWIPRLAHLKRGDWVTVDGRIDSLSAVSIALKDCEAVGL